MASNERMEYTFLNLKKCIGNNGEFVGVTAEVVLHADKLKVRDVMTHGGSKRLAEFQTPINNREKYISDFCGTSPFVNEKGTVWATVTCWERVAERLEKLASKHADCALIVTGSIRVTTSDNGQYTNTQITVDDFLLKRDLADTMRKTPSQPGEQEQMSSKAGGAGRQQAPEERTSAPAQERVPAPAEQRPAPVSRGSTTPRYSRSGNGGGIQRSFAMPQRGIQKQCETPEPKSGSDGTLTRDGDFYDYEGD